MPWTAPGMPTVVSPVHRDLPGDQGGPTDSAARLRVAVGQSHALVRAGWPPGPALSVHANWLQRFIPSGGGRPLATPTGLAVPPLLDEDEVTRTEQADANREDRRVNPHSRTIRSSSCPACSLGHGVPPQSRGAGSQGQGGAGESTAGVPRGLPAQPDAAGSRGPASRAGQVPGPGAGPDPARADAGVPLHVLPRRGATDGGRPGDNSHSRARRPAVRRRPPEQLRRLRIPGTPAGL